MAQFWENTDRRTEKDSNTLFSPRIKFEEKMHVKNAEKSLGNIQLTTSPPLTLKQAKNKEKTEIDSRFSFGSIQF